MISYGNMQNDGDLYKILLKKEYNVTMCGGILVDYKKQTNNLVYEFSIGDDSVYDELWYINNQVVSDIISNSKEWFGVQCNEKTVNNMFLSPLIIPHTLRSFPMISMNVIKETMIIDDIGKSRKINKDLIGIPIDIEMSIKGIQFGRDKCWLICDAQRICINDKIMRSTIHDRLLDSDDADLLDKMIDIVSTASSSKIGTITASSTNLINSEIMSTHHTINSKVNN